MVWRIEVDRAAIKVLDPLDGLVANRILTLSTIASRH